MEEQSRDVWLTKSNIAVAGNHEEDVEENWVARVRVVYTGSGQTRRVGESLKSASMNLVRIMLMNYGI